MSGRRIVFTKNNYSEEDYRALWEEEKFSYIIIGKEVGESGTPHLQGYAEFTKLSKFAPIAKKHKMFCELARGTQEQAITYCKKDGDWAERGEPKAYDTKAGGEATKQKYAAIIKQAEEGKLEEIKAENPEIYLRCYTTLNKIKQANMKSLPELEELENIWAWGPPGTGKSLSARHTAGGVFYPKPMNKWWDGYEGQETVIIDDWERESHLEHHLKIWADHYDFIAETKGGSMRIRPKHIIVTSNYSMEECFSGMALEALKRRFTVHEFKVLNKNS